MCFAFATSGDRQRVKIRSAALIVLAGIIAASCSEKSVPAPEGESASSEPPLASARDSAPATAGEGGELKPPSEAKIGKDCLDFVRATKVLPAQGASADCPECPVGGTDVLRFRQTNTEAISCAGDTCNVVVTIRAVYNPGSGETIAGGLTAWIPPEQRSAYLRGHPPSGDQTYRIQITYKYRGEAWQAVEYDRAPAQ